MRDLSVCLFIASLSVCLSVCMYVCLSLILPLGKSGLRDLSMTLEVKISLSEAPISRRRKFVGIRPEK